MIGVFARLQFSLFGWLSSHSDFFIEKEIIFIMIEILMTLADQSD